jgi:hypothetical protein
MRAPWSEAWKNGMAAMGRMDCGSFNDEPFAQAEDCVRVRYRERDMNHEMSFAITAPWSSGCPHSSRARRQEEVLVVIDKLQRK